MDETCTKIKARLPWLVTRKLTPTETVETMQHLQRCTQCMQELVTVEAQHRAAKTILHRAPDVRVLNHVWRNIQADLLQKSDSVPAEERIRHELGRTSKLPGFATYWNLVTSTQSALSSSLDSIRRELTGSLGHIIRYVAWAIETQSS